MHTSKLYAYLLPSLFTSIEESVYLSLYVCSSVCLFASRITQKVVDLIV